MDPRVHSLIPFDGELYDPLWDVAVRLTAAEQALLELPVLTRLHHVKHAGAASLTTAQTYSRLEHTIGVFALACHFAPDDLTLRAAALLHDVGHLPFSHTLEGIAGLDHHEAGAAHRARPDVARALERDGVRVFDVELLAGGLRASLLKPRRGRLGLDHLDSFVRAGRVHGWLRDAPARLLASLRAAEDTLDGPAAAAVELARLMYANATFHAHPANTAPTGMVRRLFRRFAEQEPVDHTALSAASDEELWRSLLSSEVTREDAERLLRAPGDLASRPVTDGIDPPASLELLEIPTLYVYQPFSAATSAADEWLARASRLPTRFAVGWSEEFR